MSFPLQYSLFVVLAPLAAIVSIGMLGYAVQHRARLDSSTLVWLMLTSSGWLIFNTLELVSPSEAATLFWARLSYPFITGTPVAWMAFALQHSGRRAWIGPRSTLLLSVVPAITSLLVLTTEQHHLVWVSYDFYPVSRWLALHVVHGPWFWVHIVYGYTLVAIGAYLIGARYFQSFRLYRRQSVLLVVGALLPIAFNVVYIFNLIPGLRKDYTSLSFALAGILFGIGIFRYRLFELQPVARDVLIERMPDAMFVFDLQGALVDLNPAGSEILGADRDALIGTRVETLLLNRWPSLIGQFDGVFDGQSDLLLSDPREQRYYDLRISPLTNNRGKLTGRLFVLHDVSARKEMEAALRRRTEELEARNEDLDAFSHTVAHDLKTPLTVLLGYAQLMQRRVHLLNEEELSHYIPAIVQSGQRMTNIIDELLLLASVRKLDDVGIASVNMATIVPDVLDRLAHLIHESDAEIRMPERWPAARGYAPWIEEVWVNYISNALKYGGSPPVVELGFDSPSEDAEFVRFWVCDNGEGIPPEQQEHVFALFTRFNQLQVEGHGLGLSIVRRIVEKLGGDVGVESDVGRGSRFYFTLPLCVSELVRESATESDVA